VKFSAVKGHLESNACTKVSHVSGVTFKQNLYQLVHCSLRFNIPLHMASYTVVCTAFSSKWMTHFQPCRSESNTLKRVKQRISHIHQEEKLILLHDNARPHTGTETERIRLQVVPRPPYSPQWALPDFWLFAALTKCLKGVHFTCHKEVEADRENGSEHNMKSSTAMGLNAQHWGCCIK